MSQMIDILSPTVGPLHCRTVATAADASDVVEILRHSLYDTYTNQYDELAFDRSLHGSGVSVRSKFKKLLAALIKVGDCG